MKMIRCKIVGSHSRVQGPQCFYFQIKKASIRMFVLILWFKIPCDRNDHHQPHVTFYPSGLVLRSLDLLRGGGCPGRGGPAGGGGEVRPRGRGAGARLSPAAAQDI